MNNAYIPTVEDVYKICFITMNGWKLVDDHWEKEATTRKLHYHEEESNDYYAKNNLSQRFFGTDFSLDQAYDLQLLANEKVSE